MQPEQASFLLGLYIPQLKNESKISKTVVGAIPLDKSDYRPDEISPTALGLAYHTLVTELRFMDAVAAGEWDFTPMPKPESIKTSADLITWYEERFEKRIDTISKLSTEQLTKIMDFHGVYKLPAVMYLGFVISHTIHHRGQLSMYLRPMGAKVPSIYGESYDAAEARKAAAGN